MKKEIQISMDVELYHLSKEEIESIENGVLRRISCALLTVILFVYGHLQKTTIKV